MKRLITVIAVILPVVVTSIQAQGLGNTPLAGKWRAIISRDEMTDKKDGLLILQAEDKQGENTMLTVRDGIVGIVTEEPIKSTTGRIRWDSEPAIDLHLILKVEEIEGTEMTIIVIPLTGQVERLKKSSILRVELDTLNNGDVVFKFDVRQAGLSISQMERLTK